MRHKAGMEHLVKEGNERKKPATYRYDSSLDPEMSWDENPAREMAEWLIGEIVKAAEDGGAAFKGKAGDHDYPTWKGTGESFKSVKECAAKLQEITKPFLNWAGKAELGEIKIPTFELYQHETLSADVILRTARAQCADDLMEELNLDSTDDLADKIRAHEHTEPWKNRLILGDSLQVMNSLVDEGQSGQVQMIYFDPPYGVKYNSNFQPFVKKTKVSEDGDDDMIREPEMVKAFRDTWTLGIHSYLTYIRDRALLARKMLAPSGSIFVQISDTNVHHVRQVLDEVFGSKNFVSMISFRTAGSFLTRHLSATGDYIIWYAKDKESLKFNKIYEERPSDIGSQNASHVLLPDGSSRRIGKRDLDGGDKFPEGARFYMTEYLASQTPSSTTTTFEFEGKKYSKNNWRTNLDGLNRLAENNRIHVTKNDVRYRKFIDDFPFQEITNFWSNRLVSSLGDNKKIYVVRTATKIIERCMHMTTEAGDLVMDITCGSGTTPYVAEQWGRRWIAVDTSRVPIALTRQRLLTSTFRCFELKDPAAGPSGGFVYQQKRDKNGKHIGGLVPKITLKSIARNEEPEIIRIMDRPEEVKGMVRVCSTFVVESTIQSAEDLETANVDTTDFYKTMLEVLRNARQLDLRGGEALSLDSIRELPDCEHIQAECVFEAGGKEKKAAIMFGPEGSYVGSTILIKAHDEARRQGHDRLFVFGFGIMPKAQDWANGSRFPVTYVDVKHDVVMKDLLKTDMTSQIFSVTGMPEVTLKKAGTDDEGNQLYIAEINGLDVFHPGREASEELEHVDGKDLPCWMLDAKYDEHNAFFPTQVAFPSTDAWAKMMKDLKVAGDPSAWDRLGYLHGTESIPFAIGESGEIAVKVFNARGDELMKVCKAKDAVEGDG